MTTIYDIIDKIKTHLRAHPIVNTVTFGNVLEVDLSKTTIYPLSHMTLGNTTIEDQVFTVDLDFLFLDIMDYNKDYDDTDIDDRENSSNLMDIYNTQLQIANYLVSELRRGDLYSDKFQLVGNPTCVPFRDRFENELAGWSVSLQIQLPNTISIC